MYVLLDCEISVHKNCLERVRDTCSMSGSSAITGGSLRKKRDTSRPSMSMFDRIISRKPSTSSPASSEYIAVCQSYLFDRKYELDCFCLWYINSYINYYYYKLLFVYKLKHWKVHSPHGMCFTSTPILYYHPFFSCLRMTWWDGVKQDVDGRRSESQG